MTPLSFSDHLILFVAVLVFANILNLLLTVYFSDKTPKQIATEIVNRGLLPYLIFGVIISLFLESIYWIILILSKI